MSTIRTRVLAPRHLRERIAGLDGVTVVEASAPADCVVTTDASVETTLPVVVVAADPRSVADTASGFVRPDASDQSLYDQLVLASERAVGTDRSKAERLHDITSRMVAADTPEQVYELATEAAERILDFDLSYIAEAGETYFEPKAISTKLADAGYDAKMKTDEGIAGKTYQSGESIRLDDLVETTDAKPADARYRAALSVPIGNLGIFQAASRTPGAFDEHDRELVELLMSHVAETITKLQTEARLREGQQTIEALHTSTTELLACETEAELCERVVRAVEGILDFEVCVVLLARSDSDELEIVAASDSPIAPEVGTLVPTTKGIVGRTYTEQETVLLSDVRHSTDAKPHDDTYQSALSIPFGDAGVVQAISSTPGAYDERDRDLAELYISQAAAALARIRAERDVVAERDRLREFASVLSHDLRNPLNVAWGYLDIAEESGSSDDFERIGEALGRIDSLIDDVLTLAREPTVEETTFVRLDSLADAAAEAVELSSVAVDAPTPIEADPDRLLRLFENLFRNSVEHVGPDVSVRVEQLVEDGHTIGFRVVDDGPGIPAEMRERVFDSGYTTGSGTGLGLAIVHSIVEAHGWTIEVPEHPDGACFEIRTN